MESLSPLIGTFNPFTDDFYSNPYPMYERVRAEGRAVRQKLVGGWAVTGFDDCQDVLRSPAASVDRAEPMNQFPPHADLDEEIRLTIQESLLMSDPPAHTRKRRLVNRAFTPNAVERMRPQVETVTHEVLDQLAFKARRGEPIDFVADFAAPMPIYVIGEMLGLPAGDRDFVKSTSDDMVKLLDGFVGFDVPELTRTVRIFWEYLDDVFDQRRRTPRDDMITALVEVEDEGDSLSLRELRGLVMLLMAAGHETTTGLLSNSVIALQRNPDQRERLRTDPDIAENAVDELLRFDSPVQATDRLITEEFEAAGRAFQPGEFAFVLLGAANRDPDQFERANQLQLDRPDVRVLSFGHGVHHCLGAALARMEAAVALPAFLQRFPNHVVATDGLDYKRSFSLRGPLELPVEPGLRQVSADASPLVQAS